MIRNLYLFIALLLYSNLEAQVKKTTLVEHFTNTRCSVCASRNPSWNTVLNANPDVLRISFHPSSPYSSCIFNQYNKAENDDRTKFYGIFGGTPRAVINGRVTSGLSQNELDKESMTSDFSIQLKLLEFSDSLKVDALVKDETGNANGNYNIHLFISEKIVNYNAPNGEKTHHNVFRRSFSIDINSFNTNSASKDSVIIKGVVGVDEAWEKENLEVFAIVQAADKSIEQAAQLDLEKTSSVNSVSEHKIAVYPNPAKEMIKLNIKEQNLLVKIYNAQAVLVKEVVLKDSDAININDLTNGLYYLEAQTDKNKKYTTRFAK